MLLITLIWALSQPQPAASNDFVLAQGRAGNIEVGMTVDELLGRVGRENTRLIDLQLEGMFSPAIEVNLPGRKGSVRAEIGEDFRIWRLHVEDSRFKTAQGIGVGSTYRELRRAYKTHPPDNGEGAVYVVVAELGMSFGFGSSYFARPSELPGTARIRAVLLLRAPGLPRTSRREARPPAPIVADGPLAGECADPKMDRHLSRASTHRKGGRVTASPY